ncbi:MAG: glycosyltransferase 87 family protein [Acidobacteriota bacterium]
MSFLILCAAALRLTLVFRPPDLSEDVWRYLWDGHVARAGFSPWAFAPDDPAVARIAPTLRARVVHRDIRTVYPPAAQAAFRTFGGSESPSSLKIFFAAADVAVVAMLAGAGLPGGSFAAALYAFHPLPVTEIAGQGHVDSLGVCLLLASVLFALRGRRVSSGAAFALSILTKYVALAACLPLFRRGGWRAAAAAGVLGAAVWIAAARGGASPAGGLDQYATRWEFNSVLYPAAFAGMEAGAIPARAKAAFLDWKASHGHPPWTSRAFPFFYSAFFARVFLAAALALVWIAVAWRRRDVWAGVLDSVGALLIFSPTLYPWYAIWILPFAAARRDAAFLWLATALPLSYALMYATPWVPRALVYGLEYAPFAVLLLLRARGRRDPAAA